VPVVARGAGGTERSRLLRVAASTQNQAFSALLLLGREVLALDLGDLSTSVRARRGPRVPRVLSIDEVAAVLGQLDGTSCA
jgi:hypothetical protein